MALTPVEVRHLELRRGLFGYRRSSVETAIDEVAASFETVCAPAPLLVATKEPGPEMSHVGTAPAGSPVAESSMLPVVATYVT